MIADDLAEELAHELVGRRCLFIDPFCGTGRTLLAAAGHNAHAYGMDVNPLAILVTRAKTAPVRPRCALEILESVPLGKVAGATSLANHFEVEGRVLRFSSKVRHELAGIVEWINEEVRDLESRLLCAAVLSAVVREVCLFRSDQWKLHRLDASARKAFRPNPWVVFRRRLDAAVEGLIVNPLPIGSVTCGIGDARSFSTTLAKWGIRPRTADLVITSPPYGDSRTTVQYGGISDVCLRVVSQVRGLGLESVSGSHIDRACLGGELQSAQTLSSSLIGRYWKGDVSSQEGRRMAAFLADLDQSCGQVADSLKAGGKAVFVVGRRLVRHRRLFIDQFVVDAAQRRGMRLVKVVQRVIRGARHPRRIDRFARRRSSGASGNVSAIRSEYIVVLNKT